MKTKKKLKEDEKTKVFLRAKMNLLSVLIASLVLLSSVLCIGGTHPGGSFVRDISKISRNLDRALYNVLEDITGPVYTPVNISSTYYSSAKFNPRGMAGLYNITNIFMDILISKDIYPEGLIEVSKGEIKLAPIEDQWQTLLSQYAGLLVIIIIVLLLAIFMPVCGFFFCCCRCCGKCGAKAEPLDKKKDCCRKFILATLLIAAGTALLFGVVCSFVTTQHMRDGGNDLVTNVRTGLQDVDTYLNTTGKEVQILLNKNYGEFKDDLFEILDKSSSIVYDQLAKYSNAVAMTQVSSIVEGLKDIQSNLTEMKTITFFLRNHASQLSDALRKVKRDLIHALTQCYQSNECSNLSENINKLEMDVDFNSLPDVTEGMQDLNSILQGNIVESIEDGKSHLEQIEKEISKKVDKSLQDVKNTVTQAGAQITNSVSNMTSMLNEISDSIHKNTNGPLTQADKYIRDYLPYGYYVGIGISCVLLVVALLVAFGLVCGICGKKPDHYNDDCCNKSVGSRCLMCGVAIMFLTTIVLAVVTIVCFVFGVFGQRLACDSLRNYNESKVIDMIDEYMDYDKLSIKHVLSNCHQNETVYNVFRLDSHFDLDKITQNFNDYNINEVLDKLQNDIDVNVEIKILSEAGKQNLENLAASKVGDINFGKFVDELDHNLTTVDLKFLIEQLDAAIQAVERHRIQDSIQNQLKNSKMHLETYQVKLVDPMTENAEKLIDIAKNMEINLKFGHLTFSDAINGLIGEVKEAEKVLRENGTHLLKDIATNFTIAIKNQVDGYVDRVVYNLKSEIGQCGPLSNVINATLVSTCDQIILPMNGFWFVLFWSLLLFIVLIILSVKLASLYKKYDPYSYPGESEYLYDAYADREIIPLASNGKPSKKKKKNKKYDNRTAGHYPADMGDHPGARRDYPSSSGQDTRYSDMTPRQHWEDFPNGGPPQYQRAPTEYDRPPPYNYYPGNSEQQQ
ncbi:prominin-like protein isoform X2 [Onthophagus taurus]|uniref:prominin-like protein isoform X2 n=1 Tax=Onthophagus taurus TaxID=166361 RepID=UPI0039BEC2B7